MSLTSLPWPTPASLMLLGGPLTLALLVGFTNSVPQSVMRAGGAGGSLGLWQRRRRRVRDQLGAAPLLFPSTAHSPASSSSTCV